MVGMYPGGGSGGWSAQAANVHSTISYDGTGNGGKGGVMCCLQPPKCVTMDVGNDKRSYSSIRNNQWGDSRILELLGSSELYYFFEFFNVAVIHLAE